MMLLGCGGILGVVLVHIVVLVDRTHVDSTRRSADDAAYIRIDLFLQIALKEQQHYQLQ